MGFRKLVPIVTVLVAGVWLAGCDALGPERPAPQPDTDIYGTLVSVDPVPDQPGSTVLRIRIGLPRVLSGKRAEEGRPEVPVGEEGLEAKVAVTSETVAVLGSRPSGSLEGFKPGMDLVVLPVPGTTQLLGTKVVLAQAALVADFPSFRRWRLPKSLPPEDGADESAGEAVITSPGIEHAPVPVHDGRVLYFAARLRRPWREGQAWIGAARPGLEPGDAERPARERTYRTELGSGGWSAPRPVVFPGLDDALTVRVTWVNEEETICLVTVRDADGTRWVGRSTRARNRGPWGEVVRLEEAGEGSAEDAVYLAGAKHSFAFTTDRRGNLDIFLFFPKRGDEPMPLDPRIDTAGDEWAPRTGPANELLFCRGDRQLLYVKGVARPLRVDMPLRVPITEANPTGDGKWMFACVPRYTPLELDTDIVVMPWIAPGRVGSPVPIDSWRPDGPAPE